MRCGPVVISLFAHLLSFYAAAGDAPLLRAVPWRVLELGEVLRFTADWGPQVVAVTPDGQWALTDGDWVEGRIPIQLWDLKARRRGPTLPGHAGGIASLAVSPDGRWVLSAGADKTVRLWNLASRKELHRFAAPQVQRVAFSPDGRRVFGCGPKGVSVWDTETGRLVHRLDLAVKQPICVALTPDGRRVLYGCGHARLGNGDSVSKDGALRLYDVASGKELWSVEGLPTAVLSIAVAPDGRHALSAGGLIRAHRVADQPDLWVGVGEDCAPRLWDLETGKLVRRLAEPAVPVTAISFSPDGRRALSASEFPDFLADHDRSVRLWDVASGRELRRFEGHTHEVSAAVFTPDGRRAVSVGWRDQPATLRVWDLDSGWEVIELGRPRPWEPATVTLAPDGRRALAGERDGTVRLWDLAARRELHCLKGHTDPVTLAVFSPDGRLAVTYDGELIVWDLRTGQLRHRIRSPYSGTHSFAIAPDGRRAVGGHGAFAGIVTHEDALRLWDLVHGVEDYPQSLVPALRAVFEVPSWACYEAGYSEQGRRLVSWLDDDRMFCRFHGFSGIAVTSVAYTPDGRQVLSGSEDGVIRLWDVETGKLVRSYRGHREGLGGIRCLALAPDGKTFASGNGTFEDCTVRVWDLASGKELTCLRGHREAVTAVAFSPDGRRLLSGDLVGTVRLWDVTAGKELARYRVYRCYPMTIHSLAFTSDGRRALCGGADKTVRVWNLPE
jgi:WD40 repeat protein